MAIFKKTKILFVFFAAIISLSLFSCSSTDKTKIATVESDYNYAMKLLKDKSNTEAAEKFEKLYDNYPLSPWSLKAQAIAAYIYFAEEKYDDTVRIADTFIELNPTSEYTSYLQYMKSMAHFKLIPNVDRAQDYSQLASNDFKELIARFPNSIYVQDAKTKINVVDEYLAGAEMSIGRNELNNENYVGAIIHFNNVVYGYPNTNQACESYFRLYEIYYKLGMNEKFEKAKTILSEKCSNSSWIKDLKSPNSKIRESEESENKSWFSLPKIEWSKFLRIF